MSNRTLPATTDERANVEELRAWIVELTDINDELLRLAIETRDAYQKAFEDVLIGFAARGYQPAATALVTLRRVFDDAKLKARH